MQFKKANEDRAKNSGGAGVTQAASPVEAGEPSADQQPRRNNRRKKADASAVDNGSSTGGG